MALFPFAHWPPGAWAPLGENHPDANADGQAKAIDSRTGQISANVLSPSLREAVIDRAFVHRA